MATTLRRELGVTSLLEFGLLQALQRDYPTVDLAQLRSLKTVPLRLLEEHLGRRPPDQPQPPWLTRLGGGAAGAPVFVFPILAGVVAVQELAATITLSFNGAGEVEPSRIAQAWLGLGLG